MLIAQELRKKNIVEYLLYMWQVEDILRVYGCNLAKIEREYLSRFEANDEQREEIVDWYANLITMMNKEGKREQGHLEINHIVEMQLQELHEALLQSTRFPFYNATYYKTLPFIVELHNKGNRTLGEIETCLNALYGTMMLRLQQKHISEETQHAVKQITQMLGMLSDYYQKDKQGELKLEEDI